MADLTKAEVDLDKAIARDHYVELKSKSRSDAAERLVVRGLVRVYEQAGKFWAKAASYKALQELKNW